MSQVASSELRNRHTTVTDKEITSSLASTKQPTAAPGFLSVYGQLLFNNFLIWCLYSRSIATLQGVIAALSCKVRTMQADLQFKHLVKESYMFSHTRASTDDLRAVRDKWLQLQR